MSLFLADVNLTMHSNKIVNNSTYYIEYDIELYLTYSLNRLIYHVDNHYKKSYMVKNCGRSCYTIVACTLWSRVYYIGNLYVYVYQRIKCIHILLYIDGYM